MSACVCAVSGVHASRESMQCTRRMVRVQLERGRLNAGIDRLFARLPAKVMDATATSFHAGSFDAVVDKGVL